MMQKKSRSFDNGGNCSKKNSNESSMIKKLLLSKKGRTKNIISIAYDFYRSLTIGGT